MNSEKPLVSVYCLTYNHEKYIRDCLDGLVMQKTSFPFEVIVHDDASTDKTAEIVREYENLYPHLFKAIYQKENQKSKKVRILRSFVFPLIRGKYVAICEGDDYWTDENKLQDQISILENNLDCHFCVAGVEEVALDKTPCGVFHPPVPINQPFIPPEEFIKQAAKYYFQTSSYVMRYDDWKEYVMNPPEFRKKSKIGDLPMLLYFGSMGRTAYVDRVMSCYRRGAFTSYSAGRIRWSREERIAHWQRSIETWSAFDQFSEGRYKDVCSEAIAIPMFDLCINKQNAVQFFQKGNFRFFNALPLRKKAYILAAVLFKKTMLRLYEGKIKRYEDSLLQSWKRDQAETDKMRP